MEATANNRKSRWNNWLNFCEPLAIDPYLQKTEFRHRIGALMAFAVTIRQGLYGRGAQVQCSTVTSAITAVGQTIAMATGVNPTKVANSDRFLLQLQIQLAGYTKTDPPTKKKLPVEADVPELLIDMAYTNKEDTFTQATADLALIAFYYLLRIGEYTIKSTAELGKSNTKQTVQFKLEDVTFFSKDKKGRIRQLPRNASKREMMKADSATLKLDNQKNGSKAAIPLSYTFFQFVEWIQTFQTW